MFPTIGTVLQPPHDHPPPSPTATHRYAPTPTVTHRHVPSRAATQELYGEVAAELTSRQARLARHMQQSEACARVRSAFDLALDLGDRNLEELAAALELAKLWAVLTTEAVTKLAARLRRQLDELAGTELESEAATASAVRTGCYRAVTLARQELQGLLRRHPPLWSASDPDSGERAITVADRTISRLAHPLLASLAARPADDAALTEACARLVGAPPPPSLPPDHLRALPCDAMLSRLVARLGRIHGIERKAVLVDECWSVLAAATGRRPASSFYPLAAVGRFEESTMADLLPTMAWLLSRCRPVSLTSDLHALIELLPPETLPASVPLLLTASCMVRNLEAQASSSSPATTSSRGG